ncbi:MAG: hypothetical protein ACFFC7_15055 [Candidatus Hermodarchaeota archaeon]
MVLDEIGLFTIFACLIGIILFIVSLYIMLKILGLFPKDAQIKKYWYAGIGLVVLFGFGYVVAIISVLSDLADLNRLMVPIVYLFGSVFVLTMVILSFRTYKAIVD